MERERRRRNGERKEKKDWREKGIASKFVEPDEAVVEVVHLV